MHTDTPHERESQRRTQAHTLTHTHTRTNAHTHTQQRTLTQNHARETGAVMLTTQQLFQEKFIVRFSKVRSISGGSFRVAWGHIFSSILGHIQEYDMR